MEPQKRSANTPLIEKLVSEGYRFDPFQAVRLLQLFAATSISEEDAPGLPSAVLRSLTGREPVGQSALPSREVVRFRSDPSFTFPASPIREMLPPDNPAGQLQMVTAFLRLIGLQGVLPYHYTEVIMDLAQKRSSETGAFGAFLDLFHHRMLSLFYQAWKSTGYRLSMNKRR